MERVGELNYFGESCTLTSHTTVIALPRSSYGEVTQASSEGDIAKFEFEF